MRICFSFTEALGTIWIEQLTSNELIVVVSSSLSLNCFPLLDFFKDVEITASAGAIDIHTTHIDILTLHM